MKTVGKICGHTERGIARERACIRTGARNVSKKRKGFLLRCNFLQHVGHVPLPSPALKAVQCSGSALAAIAGYSCTTKGYVSTACPPVDADKADIRKLPRPS